MEWIKIEHSMPDKPEVSVMAETLGIDHDAVVGKLVRFWIWADQQALDCNAISVTQALLDRVAGCPGFTNALLIAGWLKQAKSGYCIPNFERHNGKSSKKRAVTRSRVTRFRNDPNVTKALPEVEGEVEGEKIEPKPMSANADMSVIVAAYHSRINAGSRLTKGAADKIRTRLKTYTEADLVQAVEHFAADAWWMEHNAHRGLAWFFHSDDRIDQFLNLNGRPEGWQIEHQREQARKKAQAEKDQEWLNLALGRSVSTPSTTSNSSGDVTGQQP